MASVKRINVGANPVRGAFVGSWPVLVAYAGSNRVWPPGVCSSSKGNSWCTVGSINGNDLYTVSTSVGQIYIPSYLRATTHNTLFNDADTPWLYVRATNSSASAGDGSFTANHFRSVVNTSNYAATQVKLSVSIHWTGGNYDAKNVRFLYGIKANSSVAWNNATMTGVIMDTRTLAASSSGYIHLEQTINLGPNTELLPIYFIDSSLAGGAGFEVDALVWSVESITQY